MKILLINQAFYPDVNATAQYLTDLAIDLIARKHAVTVIAGDCEYDNPSVRYPRREAYGGIQIFRIGSGGLGKKSKRARLMGALYFQMNLILRLLVLPKQDRIVGLTAPPFLAVCAILFAKLKGGKFIYWLMDMNPDEAIAAGWLSERSLAAQCARGLAAWTFRMSSVIVVLDHFMAHRLENVYKTDGKKIFEIPPWAQDKFLRPVPHEANTFRRDNRFAGKFVVMYAGNHSPCHPLDTLLDAAFHYRNDGNVVFCFVGGGSLTENVANFKNHHHLNNIFQHPYQPLASLAECLSAADLQVVVMGEPYVGITHPCKIYGILAVGSPFVFIGPKASPIGEIISSENIGDVVAHGDTKGLISIIEKNRGLDKDARSIYANKSVSVKNSRFGRAFLSAKIISLIEN